MLKTLGLYKTHQAKEKANWTKELKKTATESLTSNLEYNGFSFCFYVFKVIPTTSWQEGGVGISSRISSMLIQHTATMSLPVAKLPIFGGLFIYKGELGVKGNTI